MAASSLGSDIFALLAILVLSLLVLLLLRHYLPLRSTPAYLTVPVFLALVLPASIILLVPIDLASHAFADEGTARGIWLPDAVLRVVWRITYWLTFVLTWFILPLLGDYVDAGHREPQDRIWYSVRSNARYQLTVLGCGIAGLIYFFMSSGVRISNIKALVMALAYAWGLILAIYLMGHGLVALPRRLLRSASIVGRLTTLQAYAPRLHERMTDAMTDLDEFESQVLQLRQRKTGTARDFQEWIEELAETSDLPESRVGLAASIRDVQIPTVITERYLADLTRKLKRARHKRMRFIEEWDRLIQEASDLQSILDATSSKRLDFGKRSGGATWYDKLSILTPYMRYQLYANILPAVRLASSGLFAIASVCIVWSEIFKDTVPQIAIVGLSIVHHPNSEDGKIGFAGQMMAAAWISYMCVAALTSIREVKVWGNRALVRRHTYGESACWYACQVAKLTVPLSYNFLTFLPESIYKDTIFYQFLGQLINLTPLGKGFSSFFPILVLLPVLATSFNLYNKIQSFFGFGVMSDEENEDGIYGGGGWRDGRGLIDRELNGNTVGGLTSRNNSPVPPSSTAPAASAAASSAAPPRDRTTVRTPATVPRPPAREERQRLINTEIPADEQGDSSFFQDFAHRVRNTLDTAERPEWIENFKRPKWLGGANGSEDSSGRADFGGGLGRWFGGRPDDGRVRL